MKGAYPPPFVALTDTEVKSTFMYVKAPTYLATHPTLATHLSLATHPSLATHRSLATHPSLAAHHYLATHAHSLTNLFSENTYLTKYMPIKLL